MTVATGLTLHHSLCKCLPCPTNALPDIDGTKTGSRPVLSGATQREGKLCSSGDHRPYILIGLTVPTVSPIISMIQHVAQSHLHVHCRAPIASNLLCFSELLDDLCSHLIVLQEVIGDGVADPGSSLRRAQLQQLVPCLL